MRKVISLFILFFFVACITCSAAELKVKSTQWLEDGTLEISLDGTSESSWAPALRDSIEITPSVPYRIIRFGNQVKISAQFQPGSYYEVNLKRGFPNSTAPDGLAEEQSLRFITKDVPVDAEWLTDGLFYPLYAQSMILPYYETNMDDQLTISLSQLYRSSLLHFVSSTKVWNGETTRKIGEKITRQQGLTNRKMVSGISLEELGVKKGPGIYSVTLDAGNEKQPVALRLIMTDLSLFVFQNGQNYHCFVYSLRNPTKPLGGVSVYLYSEKQQLICDDITDNNGYVRLTLPLQWDNEDHPHYVVATDEEEQDSVWVLVEACKESPEVPNASNRAVPAILYADRGICQRGSTISFTGLLRKATGAVCPLLPAEIVVTSPTGEEVFAQEVVADSFGFVTAQMMVEEEAPVGMYHVVLRPPRKSKGIASIYAEMDFEVIYITFSSTSSSLSVERLADNLWGYEGEVIGRQGRPVGDVPVEIFVDLSWGLFTPPEQYADYIFTLPPNPGTFTGFHFMNKTNKDGVFKGTLPVSTSIFQDGRCQAPLDVRVRAIVQASNKDGGELEIEHDFQHHIFEFYLGIRMEKDENGAPIVHCCMLRPDGTECTSTSHTLDYALVRYKWEYQLSYNPEDGKFRRVWQQVKRPVASGILELDENNRFPLPQLSEGNYTFLVKDHVTGQYLAYLDFPIGTVDITEPPVNPKKLVFHLDRECYAPGEVATVSFDSLFAGEVHYLVGIQGCSVKHFHQPLKEGLNTFQFAIPREGSGGACHVAVQAVAMEGPENLRDVAYITGDVEIPVDQSAHLVNVGIICPDEVTPGCTLPVQVTLTDAEGKPVSGRVALWGVEEAVLNLTGYQRPKPFTTVFENTRSPFTMLSTYESLYPIVTMEEVLAKMNGEPEGVSRETFAEQVAAPFRSGNSANSFSPSGKGQKEGKVHGNSLLRRQLLTEYMQTFRGKTVAARVSAQVFADVSDNPGEPAYVNVHIPADECQFRLLAVASATTGVGSAEKILLVNDPLKIEIHAPSAMLPGDKTTFQVSLLNHQSQSEWFPYHMEILTPEYASRLPLKCEGILNIPKGESASFSQDLELPSDLPKGEMVVQLTVQLADGAEKRVDFPVTIREFVQTQQEVLFQYVRQGETSEPFTISEADQSVVKIGTLLHGLRAHQVWLDTISYERLERKMRDLFSNVHLQLLEEKGLLPPLESGSTRERVLADLDSLPLYRLTNGTYSRYVNGREGWMLGTSQIMALEVLANAYCGYPLTMERRSAIIQTLKSIQANESIPYTIKAYDCCSLAMLDATEFYPYVLYLLGDKNAYPLDRFVAAMSLLMGGRSAQKHGRSEEGQQYTSLGLEVARILTPENFVAICSFGGHVDEYSTLCNMGMVIWLMASNIPQDPNLDALFAQFMTRLADCQSMRVYRLHSWVVAAISQYLLARGEKMTLQGKAHAELIRPEDGSIRHVVASDDLPMTVFENGTYCLRNTGEIPLVVIRYNTEAGDQDETSSVMQEFHLNQTFYNAAGEEIHSCKLGDLVTVRVAVESTAVENLVLEFQIPGGFQLEEESLKGRYAGELQLGIAADAQGMVPHYLEKLPASFHWFGDIIRPNLDKGATTTETYEYHLRAVYSGEYHLAPTIATVTRGEILRKIFPASQRLITIEK